MSETSPEMSKKVCNIFRIVFILIRKGVSKTKITLLDHHHIKKRGKTLRKALNDMVHEHSHHHPLTCIPHDAPTSFVSPSPRAEYEFSCSGSPAYPSYRRMMMSRTRYNSLRKNHTRYYNRTAYNMIKDDGAAGAVHVPRSNRGGRSDGGDGASTCASVVSLGLGWSPLVRQVRITDSPFTLKDGTDDRDCQVDKEAEMFIERFHKELRLQKWMAGADHYY